MRIDSSNNVAINTTTMTGKLNVRSDSSTTNANFYNVYINGYQTSANSASYTTFTSASSFTASATLSGLYGAYIVPGDTSTGTTTTLMGTQSAPSNSSSGAVTNMYCF